MCNVLHFCIGIAIVNNPVVLPPHPLLILRTYISLQIIMAASKLQLSRFLKQNLGLVHTQSRALSLVHIQREVRGDG